MAESVVSSSSFLYLILFQTLPHAGKFQRFSSFHIQLFQITLSGSKLKDKTERQYG